MNGSDRAIVTDAATLAARAPALDGSVVVGVDLRDAALDWDGLDVARTTWLACRLPPGRIATLVERGATVLPSIPDVPFDPFRADLYSYDELAAPVPGGGAPTSLDAAIGRWFRSSTSQVHDALARGIHDAMIDAALDRFVGAPDRRVVGVMGGHDVARGTALYRRASELGRALAAAGYCVATGGGPGIMEAVQLGAWMSAYPPDALAGAISRLAAAPSWEHDPDDYGRAALDVRALWPDGAESLGVPTWVYAHEPTTPFASRIAKYFANSIRENGLLAVARSGVVFAPGGPGTAQELFTDAAQNSYDLVGVRSPIVFFGRDHFERSAPGLVEATRAQAAAQGWDGLVHLGDDPDDITAFVARHDPRAPTPRPHPAAGRVRRR